MKKSIYRILPAFALLAFVSSCEEEGSTSDAKAEQKLAEYFLTAETIASNTYSMMDRARRDSLVEAGDTVVINAASVYRIGNTITIDYGNGESDNDGIERAGAISLTETGDYFSSGGSLAATFNNYKIEEVSIGGTISVTNNNNNELVIDVSNLSYGDEFAYSASKSIDWLSGFSTRNDENDDKFEIHGTSTGTESVNNITASAVFTEKMLIDRSCAYGVVEGVIDLDLSSADPEATLAFNKASLDFIKSDGCSNKVNITVSGENGSSISLPRTFNGF